MLTKKEKGYLKKLVQIKLKEMKEVEKVIARPTVKFLSIEKQYETFLKNLIKKLK
ncbi:hypothetical protein ACFL1H_02490 [Nanoarchaeota archaeon]